MSANEYIHTCRDNCEWLVEYLRVKFNEYPARHNQNWGQHCLQNLRLCANSTMMSGALLIHAIFPWWCQDWSGSQLETLQDSALTAKRIPLEQIRSKDLSASIHEDD